MEYKHVIKKTDDRIHILTINRPEADNKLNIPLMDELTQVLKESERDTECKAVIINASGEYFCSGGELGDFRIKSSMEIRDFGDSFIRLHTTITNLSKPVIAAIEGSAFGGGFSLVEACDMAVASKEAEFGVPEIKSGLAPMMALTGVMGVATRKVIMEMSLLGEPITAVRAKEIGLVNLVCKKEDVINQAISIAKRISEGNPTAVTLCKKLYQQADGLSYEKQLNCGLDMLISLLKSEDAKEVLDAKDEGRIPSWKYR